MTWEWFLIGAGVTLLLLFLHRIFKILYNIFVPYVFLGPVNLHKRAGASWAVITGATDGIGKSYSFELAARGFNIFLVSRTQSRLDTTKSEIQEEHPDIQIRTAAFDFTTASSDEYQDLLDVLNEVDIGMLVNNVGMAYEYPDLMHNVGVERLARMVTIDTLPPTLLTAGILPQMLSRKAGIIVNIGSSAGGNKLPLWAAYSASKKYVEWLSAILRKEYGQSGITIQTITPMLVATKMSGREETSFFAPDPATFARSAVNTIGNAAETTGYITHQLQYEGMNLFPEFLLDVVVRKMSGEIKEKAIAKREAARSK